MNIDGQVFKRSFGLALPATISLASNMLVSLSIVAQVFHFGYLPITIEVVRACPWYMRWLCFQELFLYAYISDSFCLSCVRIGMLKLAFCGVYFGFPGRFKYQVGL
ncbi:hypothetical protein ARMSODRAFT_548872 [Armillaria solidipes]|uniref:Uncharacterized protein n=1 Tax=Armillaria solidipes TaxID=1076256 RepID=A0A2H3AW72_9AGAR|nr:hypothetical protein ARMSODRAFT_548872 [Armillaria solidipes]